MAKVKYDALTSDADEVEAFGYKFKDGKSTDVKTEDLHNFQRGNPFFSVAKAEAEAKVAKTSTDDGSLKAVHIAGGRFVIKQDGETVKEGLNKADADAFNQLSADEREQYIS